MIISTVWIKSFAHIRHCVHDVQFLRWFNHIQSLLNHVESRCFLVKIAIHHAALTNLLSWCAMIRNINVDVVVHNRGYHGATICNMFYPAKIGALNLERRIDSLKKYHLSNTITIFIARMSNNRAVSSQSWLYASIHSSLFVLLVLIFFPTCQVRVVRLYVNVSCPTASFSSSASSAGPQLQARDRSVPRRTWAALGSECSPPDLNCKR